ncbi:peptidyl-prolyl cis-trans isomerase [candidate division KSB1 bacterium]|nr:peptidyl-prolyl cis-trans isomerase [candidate division KSB1 bacterium]
MDIKLTTIQILRLANWLKLSFLAGLIVFACAKEKKQKPLNEQILAKVGDRVIIASDFKYSYEFSFASLRRGVSQRRTYLDYLIKELLLANEGYRLGYHKNRYVTSRVSNRRRNDLLEAFFMKHVQGKVNIPEQKLEDAIKKGSVKWRMIFWPVPSLKAAHEARIEASKSDLEDFIEKKIASQEVQLKEKKFFETDWLDFLDLRPEVFDKIKNLEVGKVSEPIPYGNGYALAQILDINLEGVKVEELQYGARRKKMYERLHDIESDRIVHALMDSIITPLDVRVKGGVVEQLAPPLFEWLKNGFPQKGSLVNLVRNAPDTAKSYIKQIRDLLVQTLLTSQNGKKTVKDYLNYLSYHRKNLKQSLSYNNFKERLITEIGTMFKNEVFIGIAEDDGYADSVRIVDDLRVWEQKWTYDVCRTETVKDLDVTEQEMHDFFNFRWRELQLANVDTTRFYKYENQVYNFLLHEKHIAQLEKRLTDLRKRYPVWINEELLKELELSDGTKTHQTSLFVRKNFTGEALVPIADMKWIQF